jgi:hypothetical protein
MRKGRTIRRRVGCTAAAAKISLIMILATKASSRNEDRDGLTDRKTAESR